MNLRRLAAASVAIVIVLIAQVAGTASTNAKGAAEPITARQLIVRVDPGVTSIAAIASVSGTTVAAASVSGRPSYLLDVPVGVAPDTALATIAAQPGVDFVTPNTVINPPEIDQNRIYAWRIYAWSTGATEPTESQYAAAAVQLAAAHQLSTGAHVVVAVLDTGVQFGHPALAGSLAPGWDFVDDDPDASETLNGLDDDGDGQIDEGAGHGTHVAGIVHRVAPAATILPVRVLDDDGSGTMWNVTEGMYWAAMHGARVENLSLGTHGSAKPLRVAVSELAAENVLVVAAAGNDGLDRSMFPAAAPEAIAVGSVGAGDVVSTFSNFGTWIDVMAPGENIHSTYAFPADSYAMNSGTSMASPWVAGEAALIASLRPGDTNAAITAAIKAGATRLDRLDPTLAGKMGAGRIDIVASLRAA